MIVGLGDSTCDASQPELIQQTGQQALASAEQAMGHATEGEIYLNYSGDFIIGFSLDIGWTVNNSILAVTPSKRSA